jgi:hypothetical protein
MIMSSRCGEHHIKVKSWNPMPRFWEKAAQRQWGLVEPRDQDQDPAAFLKGAIQGEVGRHRTASAAISPCRRAMICARLYRAAAACSGVTVAAQAKRSRIPGPNVGCTS